MDSIEITVTKSGHFTYAINITGPLGKYPEVYWGRIKNVVEHIAEMVRELTLQCGELEIKVDWRC